MTRSSLRIATREERGEDDRGRRNRYTHRNHASLVQHVVGEFQRLTRLQVLAPSLVRTSRTVQPRRST